MKLIADSGSTKTIWRLIDNNQLLQSATTIGYSPQYITPAEMSEDLKGFLIPQLNIKPENVQEIQFYGTGCSTPRTKKIIQEGLLGVFTTAKANINHDLLGAARALCGKSAGIACILGTGANACVFDGENITDTIPSVGFMLGDEGSGGYFGKLLVRAFFYRELPKELELAFYETYQLERDTMLENVYKKPRPNSYLAQFTPFLRQHIKHEFVQKFITNGFQDFLNSFVLKFKEKNTLPIHFLGSVSFHFSEILQQTVARNSLTMGRILENPMEGLLEYHEVK